MIPTWVILTVMCVILNTNSIKIVSQMDSDLYVPISIVANFRRVREWTTDLNIIIKTLRESSTVTVNELGTRVKPNISDQRKTVILRDVPDCTTQVSISN
jgi:la-related protein 4